MRIATHRCLVRAVSSLPLLALLTLVPSLPRAKADALPQFTGYTRPGSPAGSKTIFVGNEQAKKNAIGGTVYYIVLERAQGKEGDPWGTGVEDFLKAFRPGVEFNGAFSGALDTSAKYLYLYQTVNDRGTLVPIQSTSVELLVDLKLNEITSWGYFASVGFATLDGERGDKAAPMAVRPVSATHSVGADAKEPVYLDSAPAVPAPQPFRLSLIPTRREGRAIKATGGIANVIWDALDPATDPDYVMLLTESEFKRPAFRAIWGAENALQKGGRSTVFGFTSNLPPTIQAVSIRGMAQDGKAAVGPGGVRPAGAVGPAGLAVGGVAAEGHAPTPLPEVIPAGIEPPPGFPPPVMPLLPPQPVAPPVAAGGAGGAVVIAPVPLTLIGSSGSGGGGTGAGSGSGNGNTGQQQTQQQSRTQSQVVNVNVQQQQRQRQQQQQQQQQGGGTTAVVPEPATFVPALLGLPFLLLLRRRRVVRREPMPCV